MTFNPQSRFVHETAEDFWLVGEGEPVLVETADARLLADGKAQTVDGNLERARDLEARAASLLPRVIAQRNRRRAKGKSLRKLIVAEFALRDGDEVEVLGYKSRTVDPDGGDAAGARHAVSRDAKGRAQPAAAHRAAAGVARPRPSPLSPRA